MRRTCSPCATGSAWARCASWGHSLGAVIGLYLAAIAPQRIAGLALVDAGGNIPEDTAQGIAASVARLGTVYPSLDAYLCLMRQLPMFEWNAYWGE